MAGIYIHIPFCAKKCAYCNFFSVVSEKKQEVLKAAIIKEAYLQKDYPGTENIETIYFGGGTPSLLNTEYLKDILSQIKHIYKLSAHPEITLEANPDDITPEKAELWLHSGFNRLSLGIQSFNDKILETLGRRHNGKVAEDAVLHSISAGFTDISADIIFGIPGLSDQTLMESINKLVNFNIPHISAYALTIEPQTTLDIMIKRGIALSPDEEQSSRQFLLTMQMLQDADYSHYEISNYAKATALSKHNTNYWKGVVYLGLGPSAHSYDINSRQWNISNIEKYINEINTGNIPAEKEIINKTLRFNEYIMTSLRTMWGTDLNYVKQEFGNEYADEVIKTATYYADNEFIDIQSNIIKLTNKGKLLADKICSDMFIIKD